MPPIRQNTHRRTLSSSSSGPQSSRLDNVRSGIQSLFTGRSTVGTRSHHPEAPKSPAVSLGLGHLPSTRLHIPYLARIRTGTSVRDSSSSTVSTASTPPYTRTTTPVNPHSADEVLANAQPLPVSAAPPRVHRSSAPRYVGVGPEEQHLAELANTGRRRRKIRMRERGCGPKMKNKKIRAKFLSSLISGVFLTLVLTIYLVLALSDRNESQEFHVLLILIILVTTIFFCHSLIRLCMMILRPAREDDIENRFLPPVSLLAVGGYANPPEPIRVALARDEEAAGIESNATKVPPPAYGLWRESVRVDPNRIFWQRNAEAPLQRIDSVRSDGRPQTANRPPSYISENGVDYIIEAQGRSIAPTTDVPLPPHPSERRIMI